MSEPKTKSQHDVSCPYMVFVGTVCHKCGCYIFKDEDEANAHKAQQAKSAKPPDPELEAAERLAEGLAGKASAESQESGLCITSLITRTKSAEAALTESNEQSESWRRTSEDLYRQLETLRAENELLHSAVCKPCSAANADMAILRARISALDKVMAAAQAVWERWESPMWKVNEPTAVCMNKLREALEKAKKFK